MTQILELKLGSLTKRSEFLYVREGDYAARGAIVVQCRKHRDDQLSSDTIRYGITATKRIGNAVTRNRAKRRLRVIAQELLPEWGQVGHDYVLIARDKTPTRDWDRLRQDARRALQSLPSSGQRLSQEPAPPGPPPI